MDEDAESSNGEKKVEVTTEDLIELSYFDTVLTEKEHKYSNKRQTIQEFIRYCRDEITKKLRQLDIKLPKQKELVTDATFAHTLNAKLEQNHSNVVTSQFKHHLLYTTITRKEFKPDSAKDFFDTF